MLNDCGELEWEVAATRAELGCLVARPADYGRLEWYVTRPAGGPACRA